MARMVCKTRTDLGNCGYKCCAGDWGKNDHKEARRAAKHRERNNWKKDVKNND